MTDEKGETVLEQFGYRRVFPRSRLYSGSDGRRAACAVQPSARRSLFATEWVEPLPGCCMFATGIITEGSESRVCSLTGCFCPATVFKDPAIFKGCDTRKEKLAAEQT